MLRRRDVLAGAGLVLPAAAWAQTPEPPRADEDWAAALAAFRISARAMLDGTAPSRPARPPSPALLAAARAALAPGNDAAPRRFFEATFDVHPLGEPAFFTGYYEPELAGALQRSEAFTAPLLARPDDLEPIPPGSAPLGPGVSAGRRDPLGALQPYPARAAIEAGALGAAGRPLVWLRDPIEAFMVHVQGAARVRLPDGRVLRLAYAGRNGRPYTSIGRVLATEQGVPPAAVDLAGLKAWVRAQGQSPEAAGGRLMARNESYIFFSIDDSLPSDAGPRGGAGVPLSALSSLAIDRQIWPYGLPFHVSVARPGEAAPLARVMVAQDTGSAIVGRARFDLFFGSGEAAGLAAGRLRQTGTAAVLLPHGDAPP